MNMRNFLSVWGLPVGLKAKLKELRRSVVSTVVRSAASPITVSSASALVIAPHPDDETFGCGGMIALKCQIGAKVSILFLTDGEASHKSCCQTSPESIGSARRFLAHEVCVGLGVGRENIHWLGLPDGSIPHVGGSDFPVVLRHMAELVELINPEEIFVPHPHDSWPDHEAASELVHHAVRQSRSCAAAKIIYYPVWLWHNLRLRMLPTVIAGRVESLDISLVMNIKLKATWSYFERKNANCGIPIVGSLPEGFMAYFATRDEIFMTARAAKHMQRS